MNFSAAVGPYLVSPSRPSQIALNIVLVIAHDKDGTIVTQAPAYIRAFPQPKQFLCAWVQPFLARMCNLLEWYLLRSTMLVV